jgi:hydroxymethylbilane synthase
VRAERALLAALEGSCHTPIAGYAAMTDERLHLRALIARPDGSACLRTGRAGAPGDAEALGRDAGEELRTRAGRGFFD